jgi:Ion channel
MQEPIAPIERLKAMAANSRSQSKRMRRLFFAALFRQIRIVWPVFSGILVIMVGCGGVAGRIEGWRVGETLYFTFVTGLTIGYGDLSPKHALARILALVIGFSGIILTGLVAAVSVQALNAADRETTEE